MTDLHDIRARMREQRRFEPAPTGGGMTRTAIFATCGVVLGFGLVLLAPRFYGNHGVAEMRTFTEARAAIEARERPMPAVPAPQLGQAAKYAGKSADEIGKIADQLCFDQAQSRQRHWSKGPRLTAEKVGEFSDPESMTHFNEQLHCLLVEAPARYCSANQRRMITSEITLYFRGIEHVNRQVASLRASIAPAFKQAAVAIDADPMNALPRDVTPDPRVVSAVEALIRAGYVTKVQRDDIGATVPKPIRDRFARVVAQNAPCPQQPWWAIWR